MIRKKVSELVGNEVLAKHIVSESGIELMVAGTKIKSDYIEKLNILGIEEVYVVENINNNGNENIELLQKVVKEDSKVIVKKIFEKNIYKNSSDISGLCEVANGIIDNVLSDEEIMTRVTNIRQGKGDLYSHSLNVCALSTILALKSGFSKEVISDIAKGSILHDLGLRNSTVPYENVEIKDLSEKEQKEYKKHVINGYDSIKDVDWLPELSKNIVLLHHERNNGNGYPFKNKGNTTSDAIKIVAVCDAFDSFLNGVGHCKHKVYETIEYLRHVSVGELDDTYVEMLLQMVALYPVGTTVLTNEGEIGVVIKQNDKQIDRPVLRIIQDKDGNEVDNVIVDLMEKLTLFIVRVIEE